MLFIAIRILLISLLVITSANAQPTPEMSRTWKDKVSPKIKKNFDEELNLIRIKPSAKTIIYARAYLEKDGSLRKLRISKDEVESDMKKAELNLIEKALLNAIKKSLPLPYGNRPDSLLKHVGLFVIYEGNGDKLEAGMTHPEDCPGP